MKFKGLAVVSMFLVLPLAASASELAINPGLWKTTMTRTNPLTGEPTTETSTRCVKETSFNPSEMMKNAKGCNLVKDELDGNTLSFRMECNVQGQTATVDGTFETDGKTGKGDMNMQLNMGGQMNMDMKMNWTSERVGDC